MTLRRQSELSVTTGTFLASGGLISLLSATVFRDPDNPLNTPNTVTAIVCFALAALVFVAGDRFSTSIALAIVCVSALLVLVMVTMSMSQLRAHTMGLLYYTFLLYLIWFGDRRFARLFGWFWLTCYWVILVVRFGATSVPMLVTLTVTSIMIGELVSHFKRRLETVSLTDPLCGVWNRRGFGVLYSHSVRALRRTGEPLSLLFIDLDDFKSINDTRGYRAGDDVLRSFVAQLRTASRAQDSPGRIGGDEFVLLAPGTDVEGARMVAERLRVEIDVAEFSYGAAEMRPDESLEDLLARASAEMSVEKRHRKHR